MSKYKFFSQITYAVIKDKLHPFELDQGNCYYHGVLAKYVKKGLTRDEAYRLCDDYNKKLPPGGYRSNSRYKVASSDELTFNK